MMARLRCSARICACAAAAALCSLVPAMPSAAYWFVDADAAVFHDDNLTNAEEVFDIVGDWAFAVSASAGYRFQFDGYSSLTLRTWMDGEKYLDVSGLDNLFLGIEAAYRRKLGLGYTAPWIGFSASTGHFSFDRDDRDGWRHRVAVSAGKRFGRRLDVWVELAYERRTTDHVRPVFPGYSGAVFNLNDLRLGLNAAYSITDRVSLDMGYEYLRGDVVSTLLVFQPGKSIYVVTSAVAADPAFGPGAFSYRLMGTAHTVGARLSVAITGRLGAALEYRRVMTLARGDNDYTKDIIRFGVSYGF
ncbi:MAG: outer membrane beta-barrel protein [Sphingomonadales bacterium]